MDGSGRSHEISAEAPRGRSRRAERAALAAIAETFPGSRGIAVALAALVEARRRWPELPSLTDVAAGAPLPEGLALPGMRKVPGTFLAAVASALAKAVAWSEEPDPAGRVLQELRAAEDRKKHGAFYTPPEVVAQTLDAIGDLAGARVLDPACGSGAFLVEAARRGAITDGADLDAEAVEVARFRVACAGGSGDFTIASALESLPERRWDAVIGNPPYVRFHEMDESLRGKLARFETCTGQFDLFAPFLERALDVVRPGGRVAFVLPALLLRGARYAHLRRFLLSRARIEQVIDHGDGAFEGVLAPTCIVVLQKADRGSLRVGGRTEMKRGVRPHVSWTRPDGRRVDVEETLWRDDPAAAFAPVSKDDARFLASLAKHPRLDEVAFLGRGVEIGRDHAALGTRGIPCVTGSDLERGHANLTRKLDVSKLPERLRPDARDLAARVLVRETGDTLTAAIVESGIASTRSVFHVIPHELALDHVLAWILSDDAQRWFELCVRAESGIFPKLRIGQLGSLRIPRH